MCDHLILQPYRVADGLNLAMACQQHFLGRPEDGWRATEWPFCDAIAAQNQAAALAFHTLPGGMPCAWSIMEHPAAGGGSPACGAIHPSRPSRSPVGLIAATLYDSTTRSALLGTYITPERRGRAFQHHAKLLLFAKLGEWIDAFYCLVAPTNESSLRGLRKIASAQWLAPDALLPANIEQERWLMGGHAVAVRIVPTAAAPGSPETPGDRP